MQDKFYIQMQWLINYLVKIVKLIKLYMARYSINIKLLMQAFISPIAKILTVTDIWRLGSCNADTQTINAHKIDT